MHEVLFIDIFNYLNDTSKRNYDRDKLNIFILSDFIFFNLKILFK